MKKIEKPAWFNFCEDYDPMAKLNSWFDENITPINDAIDDAVRLYSPNGVEDWCSTNQLKKATHQAYLINIEPLKEDTLENLVRDILDNGVLTPNGITERRAKALLNSEDC